MYNNPIGLQTPNLRRLHLDPKNIPSKHLLKRYHWKTRVKGKAIYTEPMSLHSSPTHMWFTGDVPWAQAPFHGNDSLQPSDGQASPRSRLFSDVFFRYLKWRVSWILRPRLFCGLEPLHFGAGISFTWAVSSIFFKGTFLEPLAVTL